MKWDATTLECRFFSKTTMPRGSEVNICKRSTEHTWNALSIAGISPGSLWGKMDQTACKPGSVTRPRTRDDHSSGPAIADRFSRPTRTPRAGDGPAPCGARNPYSVLLQAGLAMPSLSPGPRWALTPPFHPSRRRGGGGLLSVALSLGSPRAGVTRRLVAVEPGLSSTPEGTAIARPSDPERYVRVGGGGVNAWFDTRLRRCSP